MSKLLQIEGVVYVDQQHAYNILGRGGVCLNSRIKLTLLSHMQTTDIVQTDGYGCVEFRLKRGIIALSDL